jgi:hypothetical protein
MNSHRHNDKKNIKFLTLRLWEFNDFELKYPETRYFLTIEAFLFKFLALETPCMKNLGVI